MSSNNKFILVTLLLVISFLVNLKVSNDRKVVGDDNRFSVIIK